MEVIRDIQREEPEFKENIDLVGIKHLRIPIRLKDRDNKLQHTVCEIEVSVNLSKMERGTHMSRFTEYIHFNNKRALTYDKIKSTLIRLKKIFSANQSFISIKFPYFIEKISPVSKVKSSMGYNVEFIGKLNGNDFTFILKIDVPILTLCPCSKEISKYGAHNQRANVIVEIETKRFYWIEDIVEIAESCASSPLYTTLKRPDEKFVTEHAYENPRFVEDIVRMVSLKLKKESHIRRFKIEAVSHESIHNHSAYAVIQYEKKDNRD